MPHHGACIDRLTLIHTFVSITRALLSCDFHAVAFSWHLPLDSLKVRLCLQDLCGEARKESSQQDQDRSCNGLESVRHHRHRGVPVASASMWQQSASKPPERRYRMLADIPSSFVLDAHIHL